jgi:hypothetical protein
MAEVQLTGPDNSNDLHLSPSQKLAAAALVTALVAASRGRISADRAAKIGRTAVKTLTGLGAGHLATSVPGHGPAPTPITPDGGTLIEQLNRLESPSGKYLFFRDLRTGQNVRVPDEYFAELLEKGFIVPRKKNDKRIGDVNMMDLWATDP